MPFVLNAALLRRQVCISDIKTGMIGATGLIQSNVQALRKSVNIADLYKTN
ncbi:hypothetical protein ACJX0J_036393, partial [Zea mays]